MAAAQEDARASVTFDDQSTDGTEIVIASVRTSIDAMYQVRAPNQDKRHAMGILPAGTDRQDFTVQLDTPVTDDRTLSFSLYPEGGGSSIARDTATVTVTGNVTYLDRIPVTRVDASPEDGFNYPYYYYAPPMVDDGSDVPILVEPNNTGTATDDFQKHEERARELLNEGHFPRRISSSLGVPLLVPVFPRPESEPVDWHYYTHQLDRQTLQLSSGPLERIDLQLLRMVDHAREQLRSQEFPIREDVILNGFSASGNFVDRFTLLHPERVLSVTAGGLNGMTMLPLEEAKGHTLDYHIGIADVEELTGEPVDLDALNDVNQFLYMGAEDTNDTIPYDDAWSERMREIALDVYGEDMLSQRFPYCQSTYQQAGIEAQFKIIEDIGHRPAKDDVIIEFHRKSIAGEDVSEFGDQLGPKATFDVTPQTPTVGETIEFDASDSRTPGETLLSFSWDFDDGETAAGKVASHTFEEPGEYDVSLRVVDSSGSSLETTSTITIEDETPTSTTESSTTASPSTTTPSGTETTSSIATHEDESTTTGGEITTTSGRGPGFGIEASIAGIGGALYLLKRRLR
ncbi:MAG: PKD domain-containing protein [Haloarculaceae archaeon]